MDDTNLLSSSTQGLIHMLSIAQEFYHLNNTKINFDKAILICNRDPTDNRLPLPDLPQPYSFDMGDDSFDITPLLNNQSFRFLGVWFTISLSSTYVKKQCKTECFYSATNLEIRDSHQINLLIYTIWFLFPNWTSDSRLQFCLNKNVREYLLSLEESLKIL